MTQRPLLATWLAARPRWQALALAFLAGALAALGQAPFDLWILALPGFASLILLVALAPTPGRAAARALAGGTGHFAVALHWIVEPFLVDVARHGWMAPFAILFLSAGLALFWGAAGWIAARLAPSRPEARAVAFPVVLSVAEYLRATVLTGFPWAHPGHIWIDTPLLALAPYVGPHGLTALTLLIAGLIAAETARRSALVAALPLLLLWPLVSFAPGPVHATAPAPDAPVIRLVQPNAAQHLKWREDMIPVFFDRALTLTAEAPRDGMPAPDLVVWPETSLPQLLERSEPWRTEIGAASGAAPVIIGAQRFEGIRARNSLAFLDAEGAIAGLYDKHHLVPFGEYLPFSGLAARMGMQGLAATLNGGYAPGPGPRVLDLGGRLGRAFPMICYEAIFPGYIRRTDRPDWMVHITNDAWFGDFSGPYQHLAIARLRAAEQGIPVLRAANTGISAVIDGTGRIVAALPLGTAGVLDAQLPPALPPTFYARVGDLAALLVFLPFLWPVLAAFRKKAH